MRVLHVGETIKGGTGTYLDDIVPLQIGELGADNVRVLVPEQHTAQIPSIPKQNVYTFSRATRRGGIASLARKLRELSRHERFDVVHAHSTIAGALVRIIGPVSTGKVIYCPHGWAFEISQHKAVNQAYKAVERLLSGRCFKIVAISDSELNAGLGIGISESKFVRITNGIDVDELEVTPAEWNDDRLKVLFVGRLDRQKGYDILVAALDGLAERVSCRAAGSAVVGKDPVDLTAGGIEHLGWCRREVVLAQMAAADVIVMPSRWEGLPIVALEAMRLGKPVIATPVGGLPEVIEDGVSGRLFPTGDAGALRAILAKVERTELAEMGRAARRRLVEKFDLRDTHRALMSLYRSV